MGSSTSRVVDDDHENVTMGEDANIGTKITMSISPDLLQQPLEAPPVKAPETKASPAPVEVQTSSNLDEEQEQAEKIQALVEEINAHQFRAPRNEVQCGAERTACLQCYRETTKTGGDILTCHEAAEAFMACSRETTKDFVAKSMD